MRRIGITLGDPGGIGPEVVVKALSQIESPLDVVLFGSNCLFDLFSNIRAHRMEYVHCYDLDENIIHGISENNGRASYDYLQHAVSWGMKGALDSLVTAPINKTSWHMAGVSYTGHTTALQTLTGVNEVSMAFYTPKIKTILTTIHVPLMKVASLLTQDAFDRVVGHGRLFCKQLGIDSPRIAIAGLNPHAGENGLFGDEDQRIAEMITSYDVMGPFSPDTLYYRAFQGEFDLVISLYHDQGLIPIKLISFHEAVNVTVGLPFIRTSPDHGTAFDIAGKGLANELSMKSAILLAKKVSENAT